MKKDAAASFFTARMVALDGMANLHFLIFVLNLDANKPAQKRGCCKG
jgi:hypothetical protein